MSGFGIALRLTGILLFACLISGDGRAQTRIMPLGDSITQGGQGFASYRYPLYFDLLAASFNVDFVGQQSSLDGGGTPNPADYPDYATWFDRDHQGHWGFRTDQVSAFVAAAATAVSPEIVLLLLGTNDIGQMGAAGVSNADTNLRLIISELRSVNPSVIVLLGQIPPIGPGSSYFANAAQVGPLNAAIAMIASDLDDSPSSPVVLVDQNTGFSLQTMMQGDGLHPNLLGEAQLASGWQSAVTSYLTAANVPPFVSLTSPGSNTTWTAPLDLALNADAWDADGTIASVRFEADGVDLGSDFSTPFAITWSQVPLGTSSLVAIAEDNLGAIATSAAVLVMVESASGGVSLAVSNSSFENPVLLDGALANGPGTFGGWVFAGTPNTFVGIFNPPVGSYASAAGDATPVGAHGSNVSFLFNDGGPAESVDATQVLAAMLQPNRDYSLRVAIGRFNPAQPFSPSSYGGYRIELLAGTTVIASDADSFVPPMEEFSDAIAIVSSGDLPAPLIGEPLSIRLTITDTQAGRSTHFDNVRLSETPTAVVPLAPVSAILLGAALMLTGWISSKPRVLRSACESRVGWPWVG